MPIKFGATYLASKFNFIPLPRNNLVEEHISEDSEKQFILCRTMNSHTRVRRLTPFPPLTLQASLAFSRCSQRHAPSCSLGYSQLPSRGCSTSSDGRRWGRSPLAAGI